MTKARRTGAGQGRGRSALAGLLAVLAVLLNQFALPDHSAGAVSPALEHPAGGGRHAAGHGHSDVWHEAASGSDTASEDHGICHFCRQAATALPAPPLVLLALAGDGAAAWQGCEDPRPDLPVLQVGNRPRAPPEWA